jgi:hypothetical protein
VETEKLSAGATVNSKFCKSAIALYLSVIKRTCNRSANKSNHPIYNPLFSSRVPPLHVKIITIDSADKMFWEGLIAYLHFI